MHQLQILQLSEELRESKQAEVAYESYIKPFIDAKLQDLFGSFCDTDGLDKEMLHEIHRMALAVKSLDNEMQNYVATGEMAAYTLDKVQND